jgi:selenocysteine-specific elongation factor
VPIAAAPREGEATNIEALIAAVVGSIEQLPTKDPTENLYYSIDHCFPIKGKGTVLTGTVLTGSIKVGQEVEIANLRVNKKVKSM